jgi:hypothetical protein
MNSRLTRLLSLVVGIAMIALFGGVTAGVATAAPPTNTGNQNTVQVRGTGPNGQQFNGKFTTTGSQAAADSKTIANGNTLSPGLEAVGQLTGTLTGGGQTQPSPGAAGQQVNQPVALPISALQATCNVLDLTLGPLDLNLLGLEVHLDEVHLVINANPAGGLLGQLLCSLAGGLNGSLDTIIGLLNQILGALGGV